jgi:2-polyprenyl-3-methyl-5-hydroxy-6-metoxy-1,4-benzoquinol methylase
MSLSSTSAEFFETMYAEREDPWAFASSQYERDRYAAIVRTLGNRRYCRAFEPGCSIGILTAQLAAFCDRVEAMDISPTAVARARVYCESLSNVRILCGSLPDMIPHGEFDLVVFSEIGYYFTETQLSSVATKLVNQMNSEGTFLAAHWLGSSQDHMLDGDRVHDVLKMLPNLNPVRSERYPGFRLDRWTVA